MRAMPGHAGGAVNDHGDPNTTLLLTATRGYKAVATVIQGTMGAKKPEKRKHPWLRRLGLVVLFLVAGLLLSIIAFRFDTSELGATWTEICAYGTAVKVHKV